MKKMTLMKKIQWRHLYLPEVLRVEAVSEEGQSFILCDGEWLDMSRESTWQRLGQETNNACIRALYSK